MSVGGASCDTMNSEDCSSGEKDDAMTANLCNSDPCSSEDDATCCTQLSSPGSSPTTTYCSSIPESEVSGICVEGAGYTGALKQEKGTIECETEPCSSNDADFCCVASTSTYCSSIESGASLSGICETDKGYTGELKEDAKTIACDDEACSSSDAEKCCVASHGGVSSGSATTITDKGADGCTVSQLCAKCEGDCDTDNDCQGDLKCYQRTSSDAIVPGCSSTGYVKTSLGDHDYCYSSGDAPTCDRINSENDAFSQNMCESPHSTLKSVIVGVACSTGTCQASDCCDANPTCDTLSELGSICAGEVYTGQLKSGAGTVTCLSSACGIADASRCCAPNPTCNDINADGTTDDPFASCTAVDHIKPDLVGVLCPDGTCTYSECCDPNPKCDTLLVGYTCGTFAGQKTCSSSNMEEFNYFGGIVLEAQCKAACQSVAPGATDGAEKVSVGDTICCYWDPASKECRFVIRDDLVDAPGILQSTKAMLCQPLVVAGACPQPAYRLNTLIAEKSSTSCGGATCGVSDASTCCVPSPTCEGFACVDKVNHLRAKPTETKCPSGTCLPGICCVSNPTCAVFASCGTGQQLQASPGEITCAMATCEPSDCCVDNPTCTGFNADLKCGLGKSAKTPPGDTICALPTCYPSDCCVANSNPTCLGFSGDCGNGKSLKASPQGVTCALATCVPSDCCVENPTCAGFPGDCGNGKSLKASPGGITCVTGACQPSDCCDSNPTCTGFTTNAIQVTGSTYFTPEGKEFSYDGSYELKETGFTPKENYLQSETKLFDDKFVYFGRLHGKNPTTWTFSTGTIDGGRSRSDQPDLTVGYDTDSNSVSSNPTLAELSAGIDGIATANSWGDVTTTSCGIGKSLKRNTDTLICATGTCLPVDCCAANPTCEWLISTCGNGKSKIASPEGTICLTDVCQISECCVDNPTCKEFSAKSCGSGKYLKRFDGVFTSCASTTCQASDCCMDNPTCDNIVVGNVNKEIGVTFTCGVGTSLKEAPGKTTCAAGGCLASDCCVDNPMCATFTALASALCVGPVYKTNTLIEAKATTKCKNSPCDEEDASTCCALKGTSEVAYPFRCKSDTHWGTVGEVNNNEEVQAGCYHNRKPICTGYQQVGEVNTMTFETRPLQSQMGESVPPLVRVLPRIYQRWTVGDDGEKYLLVLISKQTEQDVSDFTSSALSWDILAYPAYIKPEGDTSTAAGFMKLGTAVHPTTGADDVFGEEYNVWGGWYRANFPESKFGQIDDTQFAER